MNPALKHFAKRALIGSGMEQFTGRRRRNSTMILAHHNVVPEGDEAAGDSSPHLRQRDFARQLDAIARSYDLMAVEELTTGKGKWLVRQVLYGFIRQCGRARSILHLGRTRPAGIVFNKATTKQRSRSPQF